MLLPLLALAMGIAPVRGAQIGQELLPVTGEEFIRSVAEDGLDASGLVVDGDVDLRSIGRVEHLFRCQDCTVLGSVNASDVVFSRVVDLSGLQVRGALDLHGASVEDAFLLQDSQRRGARIEGPTDLDLATFADVASFDGTSFDGPVQAQHLHVRGTASFTDTDFSSAARFDHAAFHDGVSFAGGEFHEEARFVRVRFGGAASFRQRRFDERATFTGATFEGRADFMLAEFRGPGRFENLTLERGANFRVIQARAPVSFQQTGANGPVDFQGAVFHEAVSLSGITTSGELSLLDVTIGSPRGLVMEPMFPAALLIDIATVEQIPGPRIRARVLAALEQTAKARGDLALANDARYTLLALQSEEHEWHQRLLDRVFYRGIGGYLVRPQHPLLTLVLLMVLAATIRAVPRVRAARASSTARTANPGRGWRHGWAEVEHTLGPVVAGLHESLSRTFRRGAAKDADPPAGASSFSASARALESTIYKVLVVVLLITLGNSNGTIREIIDALRG